jgi:GTP-binding protein HflX
MLDLADRPRRAVLVAVQLPSVDDAELQSSLGELRRLAKTLGVEVVGTVTQKRASFDPGAYLGSGRRAELKQLVERGTITEPGDAAGGGGEASEPARASAPDADADDEADEAPAADTPRFADTILVDHEISPSQARNLEKETGCAVYDRTAVILDIFHRHARSRAARAQVEMVRLQYLAPRLRESSAGRDRQRGGIGGKGAGESSLELDRRKIRDRIAELAEELAALGEEQRTRRARRARGEVARVALVGYTNAGKSTLMRELTGSEVYVADKLFATLETTVRVLQPETVPRVLVSDTVGFIKSLPHGLVASFKSTLDEALEASLLLHVVDASDAGFERQIRVTEEVLAEIGAGEVPRLLVFNKIDRLGDAAPAHQHALLERHPDALVLSARRPEDVARLRAAIVAFFSRDLVEAELRVGWDRQRLRGDIYTSCQVLDESFDEGGARYRVRAAPEVLERLRALLA